MLLFSSNTFVISIFMSLKIKIMLPIVLYGCENSYLTLREGYRAKVLEKKFLKRIVHSRRMRIWSGENFTTRNLIICVMLLYCQGK